MDRRDPGRRGRSERGFHDRPGLTCHAAPTAPHFTERIGTFLVATGVIQFDRQNRSDAGPNLAEFWDHDETCLPAITWRAVLRLVGYQIGHPFWHPKAPEDSYLIEFLSLFFTCFRGLALVESEVGQIFDEFTRLPEDDLIQVARGLGIASDRADGAAWRKRLDARGQKALIAALYKSEWAHRAAGLASTPGPN